MKNKNVVTWLIVAFIVLVILFGLYGLGITLIWALNTLFGLWIPTTFKTVMAALVLMALFSVRLVSFKGR